MLFRVSDHLGICMKKGTRTRASWNIELVIFSTRSLFDRMDEPSRKFKIKCNNRASNMRFCLWPLLAFPLVMTVAKAEIFSYNTRKNCSGVGGSRQGRGVLPSLKGAVTWMRMRRSSPTRLIVLVKSSASTRASSRRSRMHDNPVLTN